MDDKKELVQQQFGASAASYVTSKPHAKGKSLQRLVELVKPQAQWRVLDVATGAGHTALAFAPHVAQVTATDITTEMLAQTAVLAQDRSLENVSTQYADAEGLPFESDTFDLVTCRIAAHHFPDVAKFVAESARVLKPAGILAVVDNVVPASAVGDYVNAFEKLRDPSHGRCLTLAEWTDNFQAAGLTIQTIETLAKTITFASWAQRMVRDETILQQLRRRLLPAPENVRPFLQPAQEEGSLTFRLLEGIILGQKILAHE